MDSSISENILSSTFYLQKQNKNVSSRRKLAAFFFAFGLCGILGSAYLVNSQNNYFFDGTAFFSIDWSKETEQFYIQHFTSNKFIHPSGGSM